MLRRYMRWRKNGSPGGRRRVAAAALVGGLAGLAGVVGLSGVAGAAGSGATPAQTAQAKKALLVPSDLPAGWTSSASTTVSGAGFTGAPQLAHCIGVPANRIKVQPPQVNSLQFSDKGGAEQVQNTISVFPSASYAREEYAAVASHKTPHCLSALFNSDSPTGSGSGSSAGGGATVTRVSSPKGTSAYAVVIAGSSGSSAGGTSQASSPVTRTETVFFVHGQYGDAISIVTLGSEAVSASLVDHLTSEAQGRL
jgi:hypothetical protein